MRFWLTKVMFQSECISFHNAYRILPYQFDILLPAKDEVIAKNIWQYRPQQGISTRKTEQEIYPLIMI
jgi:hypothetical protein